MRGRRATIEGVIVSALVRAEIADRFDEADARWIVAAMERLDYGTAMVGDRVALAIVKLLIERDLAREDVMELARLDWRDILMAAGFENLDWPQVAAAAGMRTPPR